jgi:hypothetical protein
VSWSRVDLLSEQLVRKYSVAQGSRWGRGGPRWDGAACLQWCSSSGVGAPVSGRRNAGCWSRSGCRGAQGLGDARGWAIGAGVQPKKASTGEVLAVAQGGE